jgi:hypothetical protein
LILPLVGSLKPLGQGGKAAGEAVVWTSLVGVTATGNNLTKTAADGWGTGGAVSTKSLASGDGQVEFTATEVNTYRMCGLGNGNANANFTDIEFALYILNNGTFRVYESGTDRGLFGSYIGGDKFQVAVEGGVVKYKKNGTVFYTSLLTPSYPLLVDTALYQLGATLTAVVITGPFA